MATSAIHTVKPLSVSFPKGRLSVVTGVSGSGKTTMVLESLIPALEAACGGRPLPPHVQSVEAAGIAQVKLIDATPIGINVRSTVATYANVHDELRKAYAKTPGAKARGFKASDFSYNTGRLRCAACDGTGVVSLDVQFLPDVDVPCPDCGGSRYGKDAWTVARAHKDGPGVSLPALMACSVDEALSECDDLKAVKGRLQVLHDLGLGYLTLGEETPGLSGGEAQRLKLASEMGRGQSDTVFVFDEPTIGLHPLDVKTLMAVFQRLVDRGATVIVIEHDLDVIRNADYVVDMGPGGGVAGGEIVATGTPEETAMAEDGDGLLPVGLAEIARALMPVALAQEQRVKLGGEPVLILHGDVVPEPGVLPPVRVVEIKVLPGDHPVAQRPGMPLLRDPGPAPGDLVHVIQRLHREAQALRGKARRLRGAPVGRGIDLRDPLPLQAHSRGRRLLLSGLRQTVLLIIRLSVPDKDDPHAVSFSGPPCGLF